jgi:hypothetical protein
MKSSQDSCFVYRIDAANVLVEVNEAWLAFARDNWHPDFTASEVLGKPLWSQVSDSETRHIYHLLLNRVRELGLETVIPFRCDSPGIRRFMELGLSPSSPGGVEFRGRILRQERREPVPLLDTSSPRAQLLLTMCSWCKQIRVPEWTPQEPWRQRIGVWCEVERLGEILNGLYLEYPPTVSHGVCPACYATIMKEIKDGGR